MMSDLRKTMKKIGTLKRSRAMMGRCATIEGVNCYTQKMRSTSELC